MAERETRFGANIYEVLVSSKVAREGVLYVSADTLLLLPNSGALMLTADIEPTEELASSRPERSDTPPIFVVAPGLWYSARLVEHDGKPLFEDDQDTE